MSEVNNLYLGENVNFWLELRARTDIANTRHLIREIADLKGKLSFVKQRVEEIVICLKESE